MLQAISESPPQHADRHQSQHEGGRFGNGREQDCTTVTIDVITLPNNHTRVIDGASACDMPTLIGAIQEIIQVVHRPFAVEKGSEFTELTMGVADDLAAGIDALGRSLEPIQRTQIGHCSAAVEKDVFPPADEK